MWTIEVISEVHRGEWREDFYATIVSWGIRAFDESGLRFVYTGPVDVSDRRMAETLADRIQTYIRNTPAWTPIDNKHWGETDPVYGSEEYESQGIEEHRAARERADDPFYYADSVRDSHMA